MFISKILAMKIILQCQESYVLKIRDISVPLFCKLAGFNIVTRLLNSYVPNAKHFCLYCQFVNFKIYIK